MGKAGKFPCVLYISVPSFYLHFSSVFFPSFAKYFGNLKLDVLLSQFYFQTQLHQNLAENISVFFFPLKERSRFTAKWTFCAAVPFSLSHNSEKQQLVGDEAECDSHSQHVPMTHNHYSCYLYSGICIQRLFTFFFQYYFCLRTL